MRWLFALLLFVASANAQLVSTMGGAVTNIPAGGVTVPAPTFYHSFDNNSGTGTTATADAGDNCTLVGGAAWVEDPAMSGNWGIDFDADNDHLTCGTALDFQTDFSVSAFINPDSFGEGALGTIVAKSNGSTSVSWEFRLNDVGGTNGWMEIYICAAGGSPSNCDRFRTDVDHMISLVGTGWLHVGAVVTGCTNMACSAQLYINGSPVTTTLFGTNPTGVARVNDDTYTVRIGDSGSNLTTFEGDEDEIKVWAGVALSNAQMALINTAGR